MLDFRTFKTPNTATIDGKTVKVVPAMVTHLEGDTSHTVIHLLGGKAVIVPEGIDTVSASLG